MTTIIESAPSTEVGNDSRAAVEPRRQSAPRVVRTATPEAPARRRWWSSRPAPVAADLPRAQHRADDLDVRMLALRSYTWISLGTR